MFKSILVASLLVLSGSALAASASIGIFGGTGNTITGGGSQASTNGGGASAIFGATQTISGAAANNNGSASTVVTPVGVQSNNSNTSNAIGGMQSASLGLAGSGSQYNSGAIGGGLATGSFGTIGLGVVVLP